MVTGGGLLTDRKGSLHNNGFAYATPNPKITRLWTNPAPTAAFGEQTINLDLTSYDLINIVSTINTGDNYYTNHIFVKIPGKYQVLIDFSGSQKMHRNLMVSDSGIYFTGNYKYASYVADTSLATVDNTMNRPIYIYGIKL